MGAVRDTSNIPKMVHDADGDPVQGALHPGSSKILGVGVASTGTALPTNSKIVRLVCTVACYYKFGGASVAASPSDSVLLPANTIEEVATGGNLYIAGIRIGGADGVLNISRME
jgi:hypothetical protein